jgi:hypothetical protein
VAEEGKPASRLARPLPPLRPKRSAYGVAVLRSGRGRTHCHSNRVKSNATLPLAKLIPHNYQSPRRWREKNSKGDLSVLSSNRSVPQASLRFGLAGTGEWLANSSWVKSRFRVRFCITGVLFVAIARNSHRDQVSVFSSSVRNPRVKVNDAQRFTSLTARLWELRAAQGSIFVGYLRQPCPDDVVAPIWQTKLPARLWWSNTH